MSQGSEAGHIQASVTENSRDSREGDQLLCFVTRHQEAKELCGIDLGQV